MFKNNEKKQKENQKTKANRKLKNNNNKYEQKRVF